MRLIQQILDDQQEQEELLLRLESEIERIKLDKQIKKAQLAQLDLDHQNVRRHIYQVKQQIKENDSVLLKLGNK